MAIHPAFAETSFDQRLHNLLERKRSLSREMLMPPVDSTADTANLFSQTVGGSSSDAEGSPERGTPTSLEDIDSMEPLQFEDWVLNRLGSNGFDVSRTPPSHDHGADGIAVSQATGKKLIIQCKHTQPTNYADETAVQDLIRARASYESQDAVFIAITNGRGFTGGARKMGRSNEIRLIDRSMLENWPMPVTGF
jgi:HJR/Mrr/RecB family endonuclease